MSLERLAALVTRLFGLGWIASGVTLIFSLPRYALSANLAAQRRTGYAATYNTEAQWVMAHIVFDVAFGTAVFVGWRRVIKFLVKDVPRTREQE